MPETIRERYLKLCEQASREIDSKRLLELVSEINKLIAEDEQRKQELVSTTEPCSATVITPRHKP
jgi:hypothetical protein